MFNIPWRGKQWRYFIQEYKTSILWQKPCHSDLASCYPCLHCLKALLDYSQSIPMQTLLAILLLGCKHLKVWSDFIMFVANWKSTYKVIYFNALWPWLITGNFHTVWEQTILACGGNSTGWTKNFREIKVKCFICCNVDKAGSLKNKSISQSTG